MSKSPKVSAKLEAELRDRLEDLLDRADDVADKRLRLSKMLGGHLKVIKESVALVRRQLKGIDLDQLEIPGTTLPEPAKDPLLQEVLRLAGLVPQPPPEASDLDWHEEGDNQVAEVEGGTYCCEPKVKGGGWLALWTPEDKPSKSIGEYATLEDAQRACARHLLERAGDAILRNAGAGKLAEKCLACGKPADKPSPGCEECSHGRKKGGRRG